YTPEMEFNGERIARRGVVVVSVNYRLAALGFLAHPDLTKDQPDAPANFGSLDQQAGLNWVVRNIAAFGGDPENITIAGQSAGGASVMAQLTCEKNYGKFQKAVLLSGMFHNPYVPDRFITPRTLKEAEKNGKEFVEFLGVNSIEEARKLDAYFIRAKYAEYAQNHPRMSIVVDGQFCVDEPLKRFARGEYAKVPIMAGNTTDEFTGYIQAKSAAELEAQAKELFGDKAETFLSFEEVKKEANGGYGGINVIEGAVKAVFLENEKKKHPSGYYYRFRPDIPGWDNPGAFHSVDLWFFFETLGMCWRPFTGRHFDLARQMCNYWTNFMKTGNPNGDDADGTPMPVWEAYTADAKNEMEFTSEGAMPAKEDSEFIGFMVEHIREKLTK
ncbi:MAG: carboxylesterase family protein, partial [Lachnospiraceae bacterium]|nr:carboxylesterase family protein [Lachnospiraceae bacterium]